MAQITHFCLNNIGTLAILAAKKGGFSPGNRGTMTPMDTTDTEITTSEVEDTPQDPELVMVEGLEVLEEEEGKPKKKRNRFPNGKSSGLGLADSPGPGRPESLNATDPYPRHVPRPKFTVYKSDNAVHSQKPKAAFTWVRELPTWAQNKILAYVYRDWPFLVPVPDPPPGEKKTEFAYIDKVSGSEMMTDEIDFLNRYGCGRYRVIMNEEDSPGRGLGKTLCTVYVTGLSNDLKSFPPADRRVSDITQVELTHPDNRSYVEFLRMRGLLPEQKNKKDEENEMAQAALTEVLVKDLIDNKNKEREGGGDTKSLDLIADAAKRSMAMTQRAAEDYAARTRALDEDIAARRREAVALSPVAATTPAESPIRLAMELMQLMNQNRGSDEILSKFMEQSNKQMERMEKLFQDSLNRPQQQPTPIVDRIKDLKDLREISRDLFGDNKEDGGGVADGVADAAGELAPKWLRPFIPILTPIAMGLAQGIMSRGPGVVPGPGMAPPVQYPPQALPYPPQPVQFPSQPQPTPMTPIPTPAQAPGGMDPQVAALLSMIRVPFLNQIQDPALTGTDFAGWFVDGFGMPTHNQVISFGPEALFQTICQYPPIADDLAAMRMPEKRVREFVNEFCEPKWDDGGDGKREETPPPSNNTPPVVA